MKKVKYFILFLKLIKTIEERLGYIRTRSRLYRAVGKSGNLNIPDKAYNWSRDEFGAISTGKIDVDEMFIGDVYFDKALKARVKILNKSEKDAVTFKGSDS